jgi:hypothetical protein
MQTLLKRNAKIQGLGRKNLQSSQPHQTLQSLADLAQICQKCFLDDLVAEDLLKHINLSSTFSCGFHHCICEAIAAICEKNSANHLPICKLSLQKECGVSLFLLLIGMIHVQNS